MKLYFAGAEGFVEPLKMANVKRILFSYYYLDKTEKLTEFEDVFLDSGGYSARVKGIKIDIDSYINFLKLVEKRITHYANLDTESQKESEKNLEKMEKEGLNPLPVWHLSWDNKLLEDYLNSYDYVALGGMVGENLSREDIYRMIIQIVNKNKTKLHLFGITSPYFLKLVKDIIYSADSTSWMSGARFGNSYSFSETKKILEPFPDQENFKKFKYQYMNLWNLQEWKKFADFLEGEYAD